MNGFGYYILVDKKPVPIPDDDMLLWASSFGRGDRHVASTRLPWCWISTVFLGIDHNFLLSGPPVLFETMSFWPGDYQPHQYRYCTWDEAEAGHAVVVADCMRFSTVFGWLKTVFLDNLREAGVEFLEVFR